MSTDFDAYRIGDTSRFVAKLEDEVRATRPGEPVSGLDAIEGSDPSGTVYCVVNIHGELVQVGITDGWWHQVGAHAVAPAILQALELSLDLIPSGKIDSWRGPAHETFKTRVRAQADAIDAVVGKVTATSTWLASVAQANVDFVSDLTTQVAEIVSVLTSVGADIAEVAATDVAGAVQASNHASEGTGQAVAMILNYLASLASRLAGVVAQINELANEYGDHTGLPQGRWPQAVNA